MKEFLSFEEVLKELNIDESELKKMVSEGQVRAFRSENKMKFKREDIEKLKRSDTDVIPPITGSDTGKSETMEYTQTDDVIAEDIGESPKPDLLEEVPLESTGGDTSEINAQTDELQVDLETTEIPIEETKPSKAVKSKPKVRSLQKPIVIEETKSPILWIIVLFITTIILTFGSVVTYEALMFEKNTSNMPVVSRGIVRWFLDKYWKDPEWVKWHEERLTKGRDNEPIFPSKVMGYKTPVNEPSLPE